MERKEPWQLTVIRTQGLRLMRPEKSWRPIVTVEVDKHDSHETVLGVDGQNPNLKETFRFHQADMSSRVDFKIWHRSQSKKKGKKRNLVASSTHSLGELLKKQETEPRLEIRLHCQSASNRAISSRGKPQNGALMHLRVRPPMAPLTSPPLLCPSDTGYSSDASSSSRASSTLIPPSPIDDEPKPPQPSILRRRRVRGYALGSDEEVFSSDGEEIEERKPLPLFSDPEDFPQQTYWNSSDDDSPRNQPSHPKSSWGWISASLLPKYTEKIEVLEPRPLSLTGRVLASFTMYSELKEATMDSEYDKVFARLQMEWTYMGGLLVALAAVDTAVFSISPDSLFGVNSYARSAIATSSITSGLGIACDAWFLLRYNWADLQTFIARARDVYGSYFFFSLSARVPGLCMFISALSLMLFLGLVAFDAWPEGVIAVCFMVGVVMSLQFLVYGAHWCVGRVVEGGRTGIRAVRRVTG
ncbi:uncharacterized protein LACBIDRAFT_299945 [Laccaria bicolor S238N-H82]|uniref:Predicted protein n=1 Tax=Laccaria bicolor (strain S238N-H82 / ATCC MYA-4686) TaxID=486041 RepID=B0DFP9_LACBS|nr:uncharacterized protein LACBIDRAFT_299945 [Laccaria bicolor S238N-H82]EDR06386.1 predicted protein [Laccaria bicolor S238N-H82]|eukprot:XP_001882758.1 predicted protein [Laccaria bicolor S238N-H82]